MAIKIDLDYSKLAKTNLKEFYLVNNKDKVNKKITEKERELLKNISFQMSPGEKIGIIGENGSGKSTIIELLLRFYEHNDANHDNTNHDNSGDTKESSGTAPVSYPALTFDTCGGSSIKAVRAWKGHMINLSGYRPTREGYEFSGWYADRNLTQPITEIRLDGNRTVYAGWIKQAEQTGENSKPKAVPARHKP